MLGVYEHCRLEWTLLASDNTPIELPGGYERPGCRIRIIPTASSFDPYQLFGAR